MKATVSAHGAVEPTLRAAPLCGREPRATTAASRPEDRP